MEYSKSSATYRDRVVEQLLIIQDRERGINLRPRILPVLDLCERLQADAVRIETELEAHAAANPVCRRFMAVPASAPSPLCRSSPQSKNHLVSAGVMSPPISGFHAARVPVRREPDP